MSYLARLKALNAEKHIPEQPSKPSKAPFEGFEGYRGKPFLTGVTFEQPHLQREADRKNRAALRAGITDRWCSCGHQAGLAWPDRNGNDVWVCDECAPTRGLA